MIPTPGFFSIIRISLTTDSPDMMVDVVLEGRFNAEGVFEATTVLTKCGSRYEASPEELRT